LALPVEPEHGPATILVVDDMPENLEVIGGLLQPHYAVRVANSGERALRAAQTEPRPHLILLDIMMPDMDGYAVLAALRESPATRDIPVIFVTAMSGDENEQFGLDLGAVDYVTKPLRPAILLSRVRNHLELKFARDKLQDWNGSLQREVERRMRENEMVKDVSLHALATLAEARDRDTGNHIVRTRFYVEALGRHLLRCGLYTEELGDGRLDHIVRAAPLHDIGKVGIPDYILHKPGKLTADEFEIMKGHARIGAEAIAEAIRRVSREPGCDEAQGRDALAFLHMAQEIAGAHHEKWDGSGYPLGLRGTAIPLSARLMALADVFDALSHARVYKESFSVEKVDSILLAGRGAHFDPALVDAYGSIRDELYSLCARYPDQH
jgi:putative two-component system response regulator